MTILSAVLLLSTLLLPSHAFSPSPDRTRKTVVVSADTTSFGRTNSVVPEVPALLVPQQQSRSTIPLYQLALAGAMATVVGDAAMHPIDCIKTLQQSDEGMALDFVEASRVLYQQNQGVSGFYRGLTTYLVTDAGAGAIKFGVYEFLKAWSKRNFASQKEETEFLQSASLYLAAGIAFVFSSTILVPGEFLKQQLQMGHYDTLGDAVSHVYATSGMSGFLSGYQGVCLRDIPYTMMELGLYDTIKKGIVKSKDSEDTVEGTKSLDISQEIMAAAITGGIAGFLTTPLDTIKTKLMVDMYDGGFASCFATTLHDHGWAALFSGAAARVAWLLPFSAIYLPLFDAMKRQLGTLSNSQQGR